MDNLLPISKGKADEPNARVQHMSSWHVEKSNPRNDANIPYGLVDFKEGEDVYEDKWLLNDPPMAEPNKRNQDEVYSKEVGPSPLSASERGVADSALIAMPKSDDMSSVSSMYHTKSRGGAISDELIISVSNLMPSNTDTYMQRAGSISTSVLRPNMQREHNLSQRVKVPASDAKASSTRPLSVLMAPLERIAVTMSGRHQVQDFDFSSGSIGMEIEIKFDRLICTNVLPASQAEKYKVELTDAEIVAVNGLRVLNLEDFQKSVYDANKFGTITITCVVFKEGKHTDQFYAQFSAAKKATVKSLFSGLLAGGVDEDHQHGMELPTASNDEDDDSSEEEEENEEDNGEEKDNKSSGDRSDAKMGPGDVDDAKGEAKDAALSRAETRDSEEEGTSGWFDVPSESRDSDDSDDNITSIRKKPLYSSSKAEEKPSAPVTQLKATDDGDELMVGRAHRGRSADDLDDEGYDVGGEEEEAAGGEEEEPNSSDEGEEEDDVVTEIKSLSVVEIKEEDEDLEVDTWNFATALDIEEMVPFSRVVCVPALFGRSSDWGMPKNHIQFVNYSDNYKVRVCWVDEDGSLIPRASLATHSVAKHVEMTSPSHVWCLVATKIVEGADAHAPSNAERDLVGDVSYNNPTAMIFVRPNREALLESNFVCMTWKPWQSIFATQKARPKRLPAHQRLDKAKYDEDIAPDIMISIMDDGLDNM